MGAIGREGTVAEILRRRVCAILRANDEQVAREAVRAAVEGGIRLVEFTLTTPGALGLIAEFAEDDQLVVGAGTVLTPGEARDAVAAGARFVVSPVGDEAVVRLARELDVASVPGTFTATEMIAAQRWGADFVKLFPAPADIPAYVRSLLGPLPGLRIIPTNAVTVDNFVDILRAGAVGVGFNTHLFRAEELAAGDYASIESRSAEIVRRLERM